MAALDSLRRLPPWALYGGAGVVAGSGYLLYKKRKAAAAGATSGTPTSLNVTAPLQTDSGQQAGVVPYYLTANPAATGGGWRQPPPPVGAAVPSGSSATGSTGTPGSVLPDIPPLLPISPTGPAPAPAPAPVTAAPTPAPAPQNNNIPADLMAKIAANGEKILTGIPSPNGGMWWLGSKGGVFAINAPYYGGPAGQSYWGNRTPATILPSGSGYKVVDTAGEVYNYGG